MPHPAPEQVVTLTVSQVRDLVVEIDQRHRRAPSLKALCDEVVYSLAFAAPAREDAEKQRLMAFAGAVIASDWDDGRSLVDAGLMDIVSGSEEDGPDECVLTSFGDQCLAAFGRREQAKAEKEKGDE